MKKGANILRRVLAMAFAVAFLVSMLPTQLAAEAAEGTSTGDVTFTATGTGIIGTELTLAAETSNDGTETSGYDSNGESGYNYNTSDTAGDDTWQDDGEPTTSTAWTWSSGNSDVNSAISTATASDVSFAVPETTSSITVTATYTKTVTTTEAKVSSTENESGTYDVYMRHRVTTTTWTGTYTFTPEYDTVESIVLSSSALDNGTLTLDMVNNKTATLTATLTGVNGGVVNPNSVAWSNSKTAVVTLEEDSESWNICTLTAVGLGTDTITASVGSVTTTCAVEVKEVTTTNTGDDVTLEYGDSKELSVTDQGGTVTWSSSDTSVATVDSTGNVTAVGVGSATVTATETGTSYTTTTTFDVTVTTATRSVTIAGDSVMTYGDEQTLTASNTGSGIVTWESSDENVVKVDENGAVTAVGKGEATVTVTVTETGYEDATDTLTITVNPITLTVEYDNTTITKVSDGTKDVTTDNRTAIQNALTLSDGKVGTDDVDFEIKSYGEYSESGVSDSLTITVTVALTGNTANNYDLSVTTITLNAEITAAAPTESTLDLATGSVTLKLSDSESITFASATNTDGNGAYWFMDEDTLALETNGYTLYTDAACEDENAFDGSMTEGEGKTQALYVKNASGVVYGPITVTYNYDGTAPTAGTVVTSDSVTEGEIDFTNDTLTYTVTVSDDLSGVDSSSIRYYISTSDAEATDPTWVTPTIMDNEDGTYSFTVTTAASGYLHMTASDCAGNESEEAVSRPMVIERNTPAVTIKAQDDDTVTDVANTHSFTVTASDEVTDTSAENEYYSGIASITLTLTGTDADGNDVSESETETYNAPPPTQALQMLSSRQWRLPSLTISTMLPAVPTP